MAFFSGLILYEIYASLISKIDSKKVSIISGLILFLYVIFQINPVTSFLFLEKQNIVLIFVFYPALIIWMIESNISQIFFNHKIWDKLGEISYDIFLWHYVFIIYLRILVDSGRISFEFNDVSMAIFALAMIMMGTLSYYTLEKPLYRIISKMNMRIIDIWNESFDKND